MKKILVLGSVLLLSGCIFTGTSRVAQVKPIEEPIKNIPQPITFGTSTMTLVTETTSSVPFEWGDMVTSSVPYTLITQTKKQIWKLPATSVEITTPVMEYTNEPTRAEQFNRTVLEKAEKTANLYLTEIVNNWSNDIENPEMGNELGINVVMIHQTANLISLEYHVYTYYAGAAHPNVHSYSLNFSLKEGRELSLKELFLPDIQYLAELSDLSYHSLMDNQKNNTDDVTELEEEWVKQGTAPEEESFHTVNLTTSGLKILFDAYDVDAYVSGPHEVTIPYSELKGILNLDLLKK